MATSERLRLQADELAFVFDSEVGVKAADLADFLKKASTVSRRAGAELYVVGLREGSLAVVARVLRKVGKASLEEAKSSPIRTAGAAVGIVSIVAMALMSAIKPDQAGATPLSKAGAVLVEDKSITQISLVTIDRSTVVMDREMAEEVRRLEGERGRTLLAAPDVRLLIEHAATSGIRGKFVDAGGEPHFRPDGFRYLVPVALPPSIDPAALAPGRGGVVRGELLLKESRPDLLVVREIEPS